jgi:methylaspartate ammonia-lyase
MEITWHITVSVPQLDIWGEKLVASVDSIKAEMVRLGENQAAEAQALTEQVTRIAEEITQWNASGTPVTDEQMQNLETAIKAAADAAAAHTAQIRANSEAIQGIIPDTPPVTP